MDSMPAFKDTPQYRREIQRERDALWHLDRIAADLVDSTAAISHWGSGIPYDGVIDALARRVWQLIGISDSDVERSVTQHNRRRKTFTARESLLIFERDDYKCVRCGDKRNLTVDHIYPWSKGGSDDPDNLQTLCSSCNSAKGNRA